VLGGLAVCAVACALQPAVPDAGPGPNAAVAVICLAGATVLWRRISTSPAISRAKRIGFAYAALGGAAGIGAIAVHIAVVDGAKQPALVFILAAAIVILRSPEIPSDESGDGAAPRAPSSD
jgi:hypothetical protein